MKKWFIAGLFLLILALSIFTVATINRVVESGNSVDRQVMDVAMQETPIVEVTDTNHYFGSQPITVLYGKDKDNKEMIGLVKEEDGSLITYEWLEKGISKEEVHTKVMRDYSVEKQIHIIPGIENGILLWEALYRNREGDYQYVYYRFYDGEFLQSLKLRKPRGS